MEEKNYIVDISESKAGDLCVYDIKNDLYVNVPFENSSFLNGNTDYNRIGVVVIPSSHNVYGDGSCGVMSLLSMSCTTPTTGEYSFSGMCWGEDVTIIDDTYNVGNYVGINTDIHKEVQGTYKTVHVPSDYYDHYIEGNEPFQNPYDTKSWYYYSDTSYGSAGTFYQAPSPYNEDGSRNVAYYQTSSPSSSSNFLSDFDGRGHTDKILEYRGVKDYTSWKPTYNSTSDFPAASCCDMYCPSGTKQGDWYLPSAGEIGYLFSRLKTINDTLSNWGFAFTTSTTTLQNSSEVGCDVIFGGTLSYNKLSKTYYNTHCRAFIKVKN